MPTADFPKSPLPLWACDCAAYTFDPWGEKTAGRLPGILERAGQIEVTKAYRENGGWRFTTLTKDKKGERTHYPVFTSGGAGGGFCTHCAACVPYIVGEWFKQLLGGADDRTKTEV